MNDRTPAQLLAVIRKSLDATARRFAKGGRSRKAHRAAAPAQRTKRTAVSRR